MTLETLFDLILLFYAYALLGWCMEVVLKFIQYRRFINRGFLTGPWLPIYGSGAVLITVVIDRLAPLEYSVGTTFAVSFLLCGALEFLTSYVMEKRYHARWWDYSRKPMNLQGRIWIGNLVLFGIAGVLIVELFNPLLYMLFKHIGFMLRGIIALSLTAVFIADFIMSHFVLKLVKVGVESSEADNTEEISREIRRLLSDRSIFYRRFAEAYPEVVYRTERITARLERVKAETERIRREAELRAADVRRMVETNLEQTIGVKNSIIEKQDALIDMLYREETASEEMKELKHEIEARKDLLQKRRNLLPRR